MQQTTPSPEPPAELAKQADGDAARETKAKNIIRLIDNLSVLLNEELALIAARNGKAIAAMLKQKQALVGEYQKAVKAFMATGGKPSDLPLPLREELREAGKKLDAIVSKNAESLSMAAVATQKVLQVIVDSVKRERQSNQAYQNPLTRKRNASRYAQSIPLSINRVL